MNAYIYTLIWHHPRRGSCKCVHQNYYPTEQGAGMSDVSLSRLIHSPSPRSNHHASRSAVLERARRKPLPFGEAAAPFIGRASVAVPPVTDTAAAIQNPTRVYHVLVLVVQIRYPCCAVSKGPNNTSGDATRRWDHAGEQTRRRGRGSVLLSDSGAVRGAAGVHSIHPPGCRAARDLPHMSPSGVEASLRA